MVNFCLTNEERALLKSLIGKKLIKLKHDPLDKFGKETVYGRVELFFDDLVVLVDYDYQPYPLFGSDDDDHPKFSVKIIDEGDARSALVGTEQIYVSCDDTIKAITLVEDHVHVEWEGKSDDVETLIAILFKFEHGELAIQGDYMMPLLDIIKGENVADLLVRPGDEFDDDPSTKFDVKRVCLDL